MITNTNPIIVIILLIRLLVTSNALSIRLAANNNKPIKSSFTFLSIVQHKLVRLQI